MVVGVLECLSECEFSRRRKVVEDALNVLEFESQRRWGTL